MSHATTRLTASTSAVIDAKTSIRAASKDRPNGTANDAAAKWRHNVPSHRIKADCVSAVIFAPAQKHTASVLATAISVVDTRLSFGGSGRGRTRRKRWVRRPMRRANESRTRPC